MPTRSGGHVTSALPASHRTKHVCSFWAGPPNRPEAAHAADTRSRRDRRPPRLCPRKRGTGRYQGFAGETSARESSVALFGCGPGRFSLVRGTVVYSFSNGTNRPSLFGAKALRSPFLCEKVAPAAQDKPLAKLGASAPASLAEGLHKPVAGGTKQDAVPFLPKQFPTGSRRKLFPS